MTAIRTVLATPVLRMLATIIGLIGLSHAAFAAVMVLASAVAVTPPNERGFRPPSAPRCP